MTGEDIRSWIRGLPALTGTPPQAPSTFPDRPNDLFVDWLREAVAAGVREPHVCALSTVDESGVPDTRYLILKDVTDAGFWFSGSSVSMKGIELQANPHASLAFYWREQGRQIRIRGSVETETGPVRDADFVERSVTARAVAAASRTSQVLTDPDEYNRVVEESVARIDKDPGYVCENWRAWCLVPETVEFWQADQGRRHQRWQYRRTENGDYLREVLWP